MATSVYNSDDSLEHCQVSNPLLFLKHTKTHITTIGSKNTFHFWKSFRYAVLCLFSQEMRKFGAVFSRVVANLYHKTIAIRAKNRRLTREERVLCHLEKSVKQKAIRSSEKLHTIKWWHFSQQIILRG